jgi:transposase-like protein
MIEKKTNIKKQQIISEYLSGKESYLTLEKRYGIKARTIQTWVRAFRKHHPVVVDKLSDPGTPTQLAALQKQLEHTQLKNELLEEMLRLAEQHTGVDIRKKYGTRQS